MKLDKQLTRIHKWAKSLYKKQPVYFLPSLAACF